MNKAIFILSFDCEGKWGMADIIDNNIDSSITNQNLTMAYRSILALLDKHKIKGTFAFVAALIMSVLEFKEREDWFDKSNVTIYKNKRWLESFFKSTKGKNFDGWFHPTLLDFVINSGMHHEIATHGFTHLPLSEYIIDKITFKHEMARVKDVMTMKGVEIKTIVYPRNLIGYTDLLKEYRIIGYRDRLFSSNSIYFEKVKNIFHELNVLEKSQLFAVNTNRSSIESIKIPSGYFLNYQENLRKYIPSYLTKKRWRNLIQDAIDNEGVVHLWTHPHNFIKGESQYKLFDDILTMVKEAVDCDKMRIMTQQEFCTLNLKKLHS